MEKGDESEPALGGAESVVLPPSCLASGRFALSTEEESKTARIVEKRRHTSTTSLTG